MRGRGYFAILSISIAVIAVAAIAGSAGVDPPAAQAAPCPIPTTTLDGAGTLTMSGTGSCMDDPERLIPTCRSGDVWFQEDVNGAIQAPYDTGILCAAPKRIALVGGEGDDVLDISNVDGAAGFTGINTLDLLDGGNGQDTLQGGPLATGFNGGLGNDIVLARNGQADLVDCGDGTDAVQSDRAGVDVLARCEIEDLVPTPPVVTPPVKTGKREAAVKRCKRRHPPGKARRTCLRHAQTLPV